MTNPEPEVNKVKAVIGMLGLVALMSYLAHLWLDRSKGVVTSSLTL